MDGSVLITGGRGALGAYAVRRFRAAGVPVVSFDTSEDAWLTSDLSEGVEFVKGSVLDPLAMADAIRKYRVQRIVHLAAVVAPRSSAFDNVRVLPEVNVMGAATVLSVAKASGIKHVLLMSTKGVYGLTKPPHSAPAYAPIPEDQPPSPDGLYGASKVVVELLGQSFAADSGVRTIALRLGFVVMPGKTEKHGPFRALTDLIENAMRGHGTQFARGGDEMLDLVYAGDIAEALLTICLHDDVPTGVYNIGSGRAMSFFEVAKTLARKFAVDITVGPGLDPLGIGSHYHVLDITKAQRTFGYAPRFQFESALDDYRDTLVRLGLLASPAPAPSAGAVDKGSLANPTQEMAERLRL